MGYMGFGMRKEVYKRKPKPAFEKIKKYNKKHRYSNLKAEDRDDREVYVHRYFEPAYKRWWFVTAAVILLAGFSYLYYDIHIYQPQLKAEEIAAFEQDGLLDYFMDNKPAIDSLYLFVEGVDGAVRQINNHWSNGIGLTLRSNQDKSSFRKIYYSPGKDKNIVYKVKNGRLYHIIEQFESEPLKAWMIDINLKNINELDQSFIEYLGTSHEELDRLIRVVLDKKWEVVFSDRGAIIEFKKFDRQYTLYLANEYGRFPVNTTSDKNELMPGVLWQ